MAAAFPTVSLARNVRARSSTPSPKNGARPICVFSKHLQYLGYEETAEVAAEIGFDGIDFAVRPGGHVLPENVERDLPRAVAAARAADLSVPMITTAIAAADEPMAETVLRTAAAEGVAYYRMNWVSYDESKGILESLADYRRKLEGLTALNEELGLQGAYQNHAGTQIGAPVWDLHVLLDGLNPQYAGCQYDIRHATVEGGNSWPLGMELIQPYIKTTVIKDFVWAKEGGRWIEKNVPLGEGMVDFKSYYDLIRQFGIVGPISLHFEYELPEAGAPNGVRETVRLMRRDLETLRGYLSEAGIE